MASRAVGYEAEGDLTAKLSLKCWPTAKVPGLREKY